jgi:hypothetical protein
MPTIHVRATSTDRGAAAETLATIARDVASATGIEPGHVWCTFSAVDVQTVGTEVREGDGRIVYVDVWMRPRDDPAAMTRALEAACRAAAGGLGVPVEDVWGTLRPVEPGRVFAGGAMLDV